MNRPEWALILSISVFLTVGLGLFVFAESKDSDPVVNARIDVEKPSRGQAFQLTIDLSWEGDSNLYSTSFPKVAFPENLRIKGKRSNVKVRNGAIHRMYHYEIIADKAQEYSIGPIEISLRKSTGEQITLKAEKLTFGVIEPPASIAGGLKKIRQLPYSRRLGAGLIIISVIIGAVAIKLIMRQRRQGI